MTKTKERMQTKASHRETGARLFLTRHAKGVEVTLEGGTARITQMAMSI